MKKHLTILGIFVIVLICTKRVRGDDPAATAAALAAAIQQQELLQSYGDSWAERHGYQYNPWTSYYQYRDERRYGNAERRAWMLNSILDDDR
jgi:hypothetical protein